MCKLLIVTKAQKIKDQKKFINKSLELVSRSERSGVGYFGVSSDAVFFEKSVDSNMRYGLDRPLYNPDYIQKTYEHTKTIPKTFQGFTGSMVFHGRTSTNEVSLRNTHPILKHDWYLSHNGVVSNKGMSYSMVTSNDTEHILEHLSQRGIEYMSDNLSGYYAAGAISPQNKLYVFRDKIAPLFCAYIKDIGSEVFATAQNHIEELCEHMKYKSSHIYKMNNDTLLIYNALNGTLETSKTFVSKGYTYAESSKAHLSLGTTLDEKPVKTTQNQIDNVLDDSEKSFLHFGNNLPKNYDIFWFSGEPITRKDYERLPEIDKLDCVFYDRSSNMEFDLQWFHENKDLRSDEHYRA